MKPAMKIGIVGGTGREGKGIAQRWAKAGHEVAIGSRDAARAAARAAELSEEAGVTIRGADNAAVCRDAEVVLLSVPYDAHRPTIEGLADVLRGKVVIDITVPLKPPKVREVQLPESGAAALATQQLLGPETKVVATLHHVSSAHLGEADAHIDCDVLTCSDDAEALTKVLSLLTDLGLRGIDAGKLANAVALESLTPVLLHINKKYKSPGSGIRITGLPE